MAYALEGAVFVSGAAVQWLRDGLGIIDDAAAIEPLAATIADTEGVYVVPAFTGLGSPRWDPYARGTIVGLSRGTGRAHLARAVVEAMGFQVRDVVDAMAAGVGRPVTELRVDGGASVMDLLLQLQADQTGSRWRGPPDRDHRTRGRHLGRTGRGRVGLAGRAGEPLAQGRRLRAVRHPGGGRPAARPVDAGGRPSPRLGP